MHLANLGEHPGKGMDVRVCGVRERGKRRRVALLDNECSRQQAAGYQQGASP